MFKLFLCAIINRRTLKQKTKDSQSYEYDSSKEHKSKLAGVAKHNLRKYKSDAYCADNIFLIYGTDNIVRDVKAVYHQEFDEAVKIYNENQSRADRRIEDYFEHVANKEQDMVVEIIIQVGDRDYWQEHRENKVFMRRLYKMMLDELQYLIPQFVIANAVVHMDEDKKTDIPTHKIGKLSVMRDPLLNGMKKAPFHRILAT